MGKGASHRGRWRSAARLNKRGGHRSVGYRSVHHHGPTKRRKRVGFSRHNHFRTVRKFLGF